MAGTDLDFIFPFQHLNSNQDFYTSIGLLNDENTQTFKLPVFNPFSNENSSDLNLTIPNNWNPYSCKYITTDELGDLNYNSNYITALQINSRSLRKNFYP